MKSLGNKLTLVFTDETRHSIQYFFVDDIDDAIGSAPWHGIELVLSRGVGYSGIQEEVYRTSLVEAYRGIT